MKSFIVIMLLSVAALANASGQNNGVCYEQSALNFLQDSIIKNTYRIRFNGHSDTVKTVLVNSCFAKYPIEDEALKKYMESEKELLNDMYLSSNYSALNDYGGVVELTLRNNKRPLFQFRKKCTLKVEQHIHIGDRICVWIILNRNYKSTTNYFFIINSEGEIITYCEQDIILQKH